MKWSNIYIFIFSTACILVVGCSREALITPSSTHQNRNRAAEESENEKKEKREREWGWWWWWYACMLCVCVCDEWRESTFACEEEVTSEDQGMERCTATHPSSL